MCNCGTLWHHRHSNNMKRSLQNGRDNKVIDEEVFKWYCMYAMVKHNY